MIAMECKCGEPLKKHYKCCPVCANKIPKIPQKIPKAKRVGRLASAFPGAKRNEEGIADITKLDTVPRNASKNLQFKRIPLEDYHYHLKNFAKWIKKWSRKFGFDIEVDIKDIIETPEACLPMNIKQYLSGSMRGGRVFENQVRTAFKIMKKIREGENITCIGATMCGKTGTSNILYFYSLIAFLEDNIKTKIVAIAPSFKSILQQGNNEFNQFLDLYGNITLSHKKRKGTLSDYLNGCDYGVPHWGSASAPETSQTRFMRTGKEIPNICKDAKEKGWGVLFLIDESHWGSGTSGRLDKSLNPFLEELATPGNKQFQWVGFSATGWVSEKATVTVLHYLGSGPAPTCAYTGWNKHLGNPIDSEQNVKPPEVKRFIDIYNESGIPIHAVSDKIYCNIKTYDKTVEQQEWYGIFCDWCRNQKKEIDHYAYQDFCTYVFAHYVNWMFATNPKKEAYVKMGRDNPDLGYKEEDGLGHCFRFKCNNTVTKRLLEKMRPWLDPDIQIFEYFEKDKDDIKSFLSEKISTGEFDPNRNFIIAVTNQARMACNMPARVCYHTEFIDPTKTTMVAVLQGLPGRSTGWFQAPLLVVSDFVYQIIKTHEEYGRAIVPYDERGTVHKNSGGNKVAGKIIRIGRGYSVVTSEVDEYLKLLNDRKHGIMFEKGMRLRSQETRTKRKGKKVKGVKTPNFNHHRAKRDEEYKKRFWNITTPFLENYVENNWKELWPNLISKPLIVPQDHNKALALYKKYNIKDDRKFYGIPTMEKFDYFHWRWSYRFVRIDGLDSSGSAGNTEVVVAQVYVNTNRNKPFNEQDQLNAQPGEPLYAYAVAFRLIKPILPYEVLESDEIWPRRATKEEREMANKMSTSDSRLQRKYSMFALHVDIKEKGKIFNE